MEYLTRHLYLQGKSQMIKEGHVPQKTFDEKLDEIYETLEKLRGPNDPPVNKPSVSIRLRAGMIDLGQIVLNNPSSGTGNNNNSLDFSNPKKEKK